MNRMDKAKSSSPNEHEETMRKEREETSTVRLLVLVRVRVLYFVLFVCVLLACVPEIIILALDLNLLRYISYWFRVCAVWYCLYGFQYHIIIMASNHKDASFSTSTGTRIRTRPRTRTRTRTVSRRRIDSHERLLTVVVCEVYTNQDKASTQERQARRRRETTLDCEFPPLAIAAVVVTYRRRRVTPPRPNRTRYRYRYRNQTKPR